MGKFKLHKSNKYDHTTPFRLEGQFLGFEMKGYKIKRLWMTTSEGDCCIKLTKEARASCDRALKPGDWVVIWGEQKLDPDTQEPQRKAYRILASQEKLSDHLSDHSSDHSPLPHQDETRTGQGVEGGAGCSPTATPAVAQSPVKTRNTTKKVTVLVCHKSDCAKRGGSRVCQALESTLADRGLADQVVVKKTGCMKRCKAGPNLVIMPDKTRYSRIDPQTIPGLVDQHFAIDPQTSEALSS